MDESVTLPDTRKTCRKEFTLSEAVAMGKALEALERPKADSRRKAKQLRGRDEQGQPVFGAEKFTTPKEGRTLDKVGETIGSSRITYQRAKAIVEAAEEDPDTFTPLVDEMDRKGKVNGLYNRMKDMKAQLQRAQISARVADLIHW